MAVTVTLNGTSVDCGEEAETMYEPIAPGLTVKLELTVPAIVPSVAVIVVDCALVKVMLLHPTVAGGFEEMKTVAVMELSDIQLTLVTVTPVPETVMLDI